MHAKTYSLLLFACLVRLATSLLKESLEICFLEMECLGCSVLCFRTTWNPVTQPLATCLESRKARLSKDGCMPSDISQMLLGANKMLYPY